MTSKISIEEINELEVKRLLKDTKFSRLKPVACSRCGKKNRLRKKIVSDKGRSKKQAF